ncbi:myosin-2 [Lolium perenne]|uniref:myosin-2 n=1 Tax=Lolium perenne TaxID=4522 RepID=UPI0021EA9CD1|nr:myosin-1-like [Lolium perenne]
MSVVATSSLSSLEAMLHSLMGRSEGGGDETQIDDDDEKEVEKEEDALESPLPPTLPVRPTARGRLPSLPRVAGAAAGSWTPPSTPSPRKGDDDVSTVEVSVAVAVAELERKAAEAEVRLRQKEEENAALRRRMESYHVRWLEYEIRIKSLEEAFHEQLASLQVARDAARIAQDAARMAQELPYDEDAPPTRLWQTDRRRSADGSRRTSAVGRLGAEFRRGSQAFEKGAVALVAEPRPQWEPGVPSADSVGDLKKLKAQFRAWKKDYEARLRRAKAEIDRDRRRQSSCWI